MFMRHCMAQCMNLTDGNINDEEPCGFDVLTGKALGDPCTENFLPEDKEKTVGCLFNTEAFTKNWNILSKVCDYIAFQYLLQWKRDTKEIVEDANKIIEMELFMQKAKEANVKTWMRLGSGHNVYFHPLDWSEIASDANLRKSVSKSIGDFMKSYGLDGVYIEWAYPGCPDNQCKLEYKKDRAGAISFLKELSAVLQTEGRTITFTIPLMDYNSIRVFLGADFHKIINRYTNFTLVQAHAQMNTANEYIGYSRDVSKMATIMKVIKNLVGPGLNKKAILTRDFNFFSIVLLAPIGKTITTKYNNAASRGYIYLTEVCDMLRKANYTKVKNINNQHYAHSNLSLVFYEDIDSIKAEINEIVKKYDMAGVFLEHLYFDDLDGACGAGRMPFTRMYAEALKGGVCKFKPIY